MILQAISLAFNTQLCDSEHCIWKTDKVRERGREGKVRVKEKERERRMRVEGGVKEAVIISPLCTLCS
jgi:hypothetical protein